MLTGDSFQLHLSIICTANHFFSEYISIKSLRGIFSKYILMKSLRGIFLQIYFNSSGQFFSEYISWKYIQIIVRNFYQNTFHENIFKFFRALFSKKLNSFAHFFSEYISWKYISGERIEILDYEMFCCHLIHSHPSQMIW